MRTTARLGALAGAVVLGLVVAQALAQRDDAFVDSRDHPAVAYTSAPTRDPVALLNERIDSGALRFGTDRDAGYLRSTLDALAIPIESQLLVFSQTSNQASHISPANPRAIYFNDTAAVGWVRGAQALEIAVQDPHQGIVFYTLDQASAGNPRFKRETGCLLCHLAWETLGVPGMIMLSTFQMADDPNAYAAGVVVDHRTPLSDRWGGWYVTGTPGSLRHRGNVPVIVKAEDLKTEPGPTPSLESVTGRIDTRGYPNGCSDAVALMILAHQTRMTNLITRVGWETRVARHNAATPRAPALSAPGRAGGLPLRVHQAVRELVDYMFFVDEAPLARPIEGSCRFAELFSARGPRDRRGRSLHQLDLNGRLMRYPCSYMIDTEAFGALPLPAKEAIFQRMWDILSGKESGAPYAHLSLADRRAITEILRDTRNDLPKYFEGVVQ